MTLKNGLMNCKQVRTPNPTVGAALELLLSANYFDFVTSQKWLLLSRFVDCKSWVHPLHCGSVYTYQKLLKQINNSCILLSQSLKMLPHLPKNSWLYSCCDTGLSFVRWVSGVLHDLLWIFDAGISCKSYIF